MPTFRVTGGALSGVMMSGNYPDNSLPGDQPGIDNSLPPYIDNSLPVPVPPPGVWPPPVPAHPIVPAPPGTPPGTIWPSPGVPSHPIAGPPVYPDQGLPPIPAEPGVPTHPIAGVPGPHPEHPIASGTYWCLVYLPGFGWKYVVVDPSLSIWHDPAAPQPTPTPHG